MNLFQCCVSYYGDFSFHPEIEDCDDAVEEFPEEAFADAHPELTCKMWLGWRTSYRASAPAAKTYQELRPRLREQFTN